MKTKKNFYLESLFLFFFTLFFFRGRLGSDDLEVYNLILAFRDLDLNIFEFSNYLKNNFANQKLYSDIFDNNNMLPDYKTLHVRFVWLLQSYLIVCMVDLLPLSNENFLFLSQYFCGLIISFYTCLSFLLLIKFFQKSIELKASILLSFLIFFSTGLISFFTGSYIESLVILLLIARYFFKNKILIFFIDFSILLIKPYYYLILVPFSFKNLSRDNLLKKLINPLILFLAVYTFRTLLFDVSYGQYSNDYTNFELNFYFVINNFFDQLLSFGYGVFFTSIIPIILILFGYREKQTIFKIIGFFLLIAFLSFFEGNHGQATGGRYFLPTLIIFLDEFQRGFSVVIKRYKKLFYFFILLTILNLPTLEYRNFNLPIYVFNSVSSGITPDRSKNENIYNFPVRSILFNHTVFANKVLFNKYKKKKFMNFYEYRIENNSIYPMTAIARVIYIIESDNKLHQQQIPNILFKYLSIFKLIYFITIFSIIFYITFLSIKIKKK
jgi:hypothetical protein